MEQEDFNKTHPRFTVTCNECGSNQVYIASTLGYSPESGQWGSIDIVCNECNNTVAIFGDFSEGQLM